MNEEILTAVFVGAVIFIGVKVITKTIKTAIKVALIVGGLAYLGLINI